MSVMRGNASEAHTAPLRSRPRLSQCCARITFAHGALQNAMVAGHKGAHQHSRREPSELSLAVIQAGLWR